eukprot:881409_1
MLQKMLHLIHKLMEADHCEMFLVKDRHISNVRSPQKLIAKSRGVVGAVVHKQAPIFIKSKADKDPRFDEKMDTFGVHPVESLLCVPLLVEKPPSSEEDEDDDDDARKKTKEMRCVGAVMVQDEKDRGGFG